MFKIEINDFDNKKRRLKKEENIMSKIKCAVLQVGNLLKKHKNFSLNTVTVTKINPAFTAVNNSARY
jgi:hypothetical protein